MEPISDAHTPSANSVTDLASSDDPRAISRMLRETPVFASRTCSRC